MKLAIGSHFALGGVSGSGKVGSQTLDSETAGAACQWQPPQLLRDLDSGAGGFVAEMIADFTADTASRLQRLRRAAADADLSRVRAEAHAIRGSAREMGADALVQLCLELEMKAPNPEARDRVQELEARFGEVSRAMARYSAQ
jgi:HPt (histidine-containing phosphotransfer) domain-containing protein